MAHKPPSFITAPCSGAGVTQRAEIAHLETADLFQNTQSGSHKELIKFNNSKISSYGTVCHTCTHVHTRILFTQSKKVYSKLGKKK